MYKILKREAVPTEALSRPSIVVHHDVQSGHIVHVFDDIDIATAPELQAEILAVRSERFIVIDLSDCRYMDTSGVSVLTWAYRTLGRGLRIVVPPRSSVARLLELLGLGSVLPLASCLDEALAQLPPRKAV